MPERNADFKAIAFVVLGAVSVIILLAFYLFNFTDSTAGVPGKDAIEVSLTCTNGFAITALYHTPGADGVMQKLKLTVVQGGSSRRYDMVPSISASGARYSDKDGEYSFWEHQGDFTFIKNEENLCVCRESGDGTHGDALNEPQARLIAERTCIKGGEALADGMYNKNTKTWWFDANLNSTRNGCNPACVVSEVTRRAEINWRCTGLRK